MDNKELGAKIKKLREEKHLTKNALANLAGVSPTYIYKVEEGISSPTVEYLGYICWGLGITLDQFFATKKESDKVSRLTKTQRKLLNDFIKSL